MSLVLHPKRHVQDVVAGAAKMTPAGIEARTAGTRPRRAQPIARVSGSSKCTMVNEYSF